MPIKSDTDKKQTFALSLLRNWNRWMLYDLKNARQLHDKRAKKSDCGQTYKKEFRVQDRPYFVN